MTPPIERKCWACKRPGMEPAAPVVSGHTLWFFKCPHCGARFQWVKEPAMDGSYAEKHKDKDAPIGQGYSVNSMLSDPDCGVFSKPRARRTRPPMQPPEVGKAGQVVFVEDEDGNRTHRWHWGRCEWVRI